MAENTNPVEVLRARLDGIRHLLDAVPEGPWNAYKKGVHKGLAFLADTNDPDTARFIAAARLDVPALLAAFDVLLREFDYYLQNGTDDEKDVITAICEQVAAALVPATSGGADA